jgi:hypothetical protein
MRSVTPFMSFAGTGCKRVVNKLGHSKNNEKKEYQDFILDPHHGNSEHFKNIGILVGVTGVNRKSQNDAASVHGK